MLDPFEVLEANGNKPQCLPLQMWFVSGCFDEYMADGMLCLERYILVKERIQQDKDELFEQIEWEDGA